MKKQVRLEVLSGRTWVTVKSAKLSAQRRYTIRAFPKQGRTSAYRIAGKLKSGNLVTSALVRVTPKEKAPQELQLTQVRATILRDTNAYRSQAGLPPLTLNKAMNSVATAWSQQMAADRAMSHNPSYSSEIPPGWTHAGENVAYGYDYSNVTVAWYDSPGHRANMLGDYTDIGIGWALDVDGLPYYTQNFAKY